MEQERYYVNLPCGDGREFVSDKIGLNTEKSIINEAIRMGIIDEEDAMFVDHAESMDKP